ncbi:polyprenyl synthetase family protein [Kribbella sp. NPDC051952]|uniref:polyprenyl synthetase family protein n=1 Tax=Kribbella sp. NPDC051952 TaxID=3154851 RepID=UPI003449D4B5
MAVLAADLPSASRHVVLGLVSTAGKGLRRTLVEVCAGEGSYAAVRAASVVELLHLASLLHDDVIDQAEVRRHLPAAHVTLGTEVALLTGLAVFGLAAQEAAELGAGANRTFATTAAHLARGEMLDVQRAFDVDFSLADYDELVRQKTGRLFWLACVLGGQAAGRSAADLAVLGQFGMDLGAAFQILDDTLDLDLDRTDKPAGTDHLLGLFGAPTLAALRRDRSGRLAELLLDVSFSAADLPAVRSMVEELGGLTEARGLAGACFRRALGRLDELSDESTRQRVLAVAQAEWSKLG